MKLSACLQGSFPLRFKIYVQNNCGSTIILTSWAGKDFYKMVQKLSFFQLQDQVLNISKAISCCKTQHCLPILFKGNFLKVLVPVKTQREYFNPLHSQRNNPMCQFVLRCFKRNRTNLTVRPR